MKKERHVLVVFPHPDDEAFAAAGLIAVQRDMGTPVTYMCGTLGEMGRNMGKPFFANRETLPRIREKELREVCSVLEIEDLRLLGLRDKTIEFEDLEEIADRIEAVIREYETSLVVTFYPGLSIHPDHNAMATAVIKAVQRLPKDQRPNVYCRAISKDCVEVLGEADIVIPIHPVLERKMEALKAHRSQTEGMFQKWEEEAKKDPNFLDRWSTEIFWTYKF